MLDMDDVVQRAITVTRDGETLWPPPPVQVSAAPAAAATQVAAGRRRNSPHSRRTRAAGRYAVGLAAVVCPRAVATFSPPSFLGYFTVFVLAVFVGFYVITNVTTRCTPR